MKFLDLFSGIGGFRLGLEKAGHTCVGHVEIDKFAQQSYNAIHKPREDEFFHADITTIGDDELQDLKQRGIDIITGGFPCQSFSIAGHRKGFEDTRGTLFFDIAKLAKEIQPKYLFLENVKGLLNHDKGDTFEVILRTLDEIGYDAEWQVLNSKHFGVPQNRERVFIIGHFREGRTRKVFPFRRESWSATENYIKPINDSKKTRELLNFDSTHRFYDISGISPCLNTMGGGGREPKISIPVLTPDRLEKRQNGRRFKEDGEPMFTLTAQDRHGVMVKEATKQGFAIAEPGDSINLEQPNSKTRRGRVGKGVANTITTSCNQAVLEPKVAILRPKRTEYGKAIRKDYESGKVDESRHNMTKLEPVFDGVSNTITTVQKDNLLLDNQQCMRIRKLTPKECWRLQGFPDWSFERAREVGVSDSQLYKQAGNSVTVNVVYEIAKRL